VTYKHVLDYGIGCSDDEARFRATAAILHGIERKHGSADWRTVAHRVFYAIEPYDGVPMGKRLTLTVDIEQAPDAG
jgi:hypothetical protein